MQLHSYRARARFGTLAAALLATCLLATPQAHAGEGKDASAGDEAIQHNGLILGAGVGVLGCTRSVCDDYHDSRPNFTVDGYLGWNFLGFVELATTGGWGRLTPQVGGRENALGFYGVEQSRYDDVADQLGVDAGDLEITGAQSSVVHVAPVVRFHFPRRGRVAMFAGGGVGYLLYRNDYDAPNGDFRLDWHGVQVPVQAGLAIYASKRVAFDLYGSYRFAWYAAGRLDHPQASGAAPAGALGDAVDGAGLDFDAKLPHLWSVNLGIRFTLLSRDYVF